MLYLPTSRRSVRRYITPVLVFSATVLVLSTLISLFLHGMIWYRGQEVVPMEQDRDQYSMHGRYAQWI